MPKSRGHKHPRQPAESHPRQPAESPQERMAAVLQSLERQGAEGLGSLEENLNNLRTLTSITNLIDDMVKSIEAKKKAKEDEARQN